MSRKKKNKKDEPSLWEIIKILWKVNGDIRQIEKESRRRRK